MTCDFFLTSELFLTGYPPQDLINRSDFHEKINFFKKKLLKLTKKTNNFNVKYSTKEKGKIFNVLLFIKKKGSVVYKKRINQYFQIMACLMKKDIFLQKK